MVVEEGRRVAEVRLRLRHGGDVQEDERLPQVVVGAEGAEPPGVTLIIAPGLP